MLRVRMRGVFHVRVIGHVDVVMRGCLGAVMSVYHKIGSLPCEIYQRARG